MVRKVFGSIENSCARAFNAIAAGFPLRTIGGATTEKWIFSNGSELVALGMDKADKLLSSEWDYIQVVQAEQLTEADWVALASRCTGRGAVVAHPQVFGDCKPDCADHWIPRRAREGRLTLINATVRDNPALYDDQGNITEKGKRRIGFLDSTLSGVNRKRYLEGLWVTSENAVFDLFDPKPEGPHVRTRSASEFRRWFLAMDEGYTNPQVNLLVGADGDGRWHVPREYYERGKLESEIVAQARAWYQEMHCERVAVDAAAAGLIAALQAAGLEAEGGKGDLVDGIRKLQDRLKVQGDGRARLTLDPGCVNTIKEFQSYQWQPGKDVPHDRDNHSLGALRYLSDVLGVDESRTSLMAEMKKQEVDKVEFYRRLAERRRRQRGR